MQRIIQITLAGRLVPIEEDAYHILNDYIRSLQRQFTGDEGKEIIGDIENRIAELFAIRLSGGAHAIDVADVKKVMETLGSASDLGGATSSSTGNQSAGYQGSSSSYTYNTPPPGSSYYRPRQPRLLRNPFDKMIGGVCSGIALYFDIDPVFVRLIMAVLFFSFGIGLLAYLIAWAIIPAAKSPNELNNNGGEPMTLHDIGRNMNEELQDLKRRAEDMSRELRDFFSKNKTR